MRRKTHEEFVRELAEVNPDVKVLGKYKNAHTKILVECRIDNYQWEAKPYTLLNKVGCPFCSGSMQYTHEQFVLKYRLKNPNKNHIIFLTEYTTSRNKILCYDEISMDYWWATADHIMSGVDNPYTKGERASKTEQKKHTDYEKEIIIKGFKVLEKYRGTHNPILHQCIKCKTKFKAAPSKLLIGHTGCPHCNKSKSKAEWVIADILDSNNINFNSEYTVKINDHSLRYDFWLPDYNCFIEYDGEDHFKPIPRGNMTMDEAQVNFERRQLYDKWKDEYCEQNNIGLLRIQCPTPFEEFENIIFDYLKGGPDYGQKIY